MMADHIEDGGPAFPTDNEAQVGANTWHYAGMSLRDHFAGLAMKGICAHPDTWGLDAEGIAGQAYALADEMLKARRA